MRSLAYASVAGLFAAALLAVGPPAAGESSRPLGTVPRVVSVAFVSPELKLHPALRITITPAAAGVGYTVSIANTGNVWLVGVAITDPAAPDCMQKVGVLGLRRPYVYRCRVRAPSRTAWHTITARGADVTGNWVTESATVRIAAAGPDDPTPLPATGPRTGFLTLLAASLLVYGALLLAMSERRSRTRRPA